MHEPLAAYMSLKGQGKTGHVRRPGMPSSYLAFSYFGKSNLLVSKCGFPIRPWKKSRLEFRQRARPPHQQRWRKSSWVEVPQT